MDEDMSFPNPVERHDLPVKKARWPKVVAVLLVFGLLCVAFLPQILHTRIGRRLLRARLEGRYAGEITIEDFRTSWFGGTSARQFWIKGNDGRVVGCLSFQSDKLSLWKLLRNKYDLGHCTIDGLVVEYLLDAGDANHSDTYERLTATPPRASVAPPTVLSKLAGQITITHGQLTLLRSQLDPVALAVQTQATKFANLNGTFDIPSLDQSWKFKLEGDYNLTAGGTICLGKAGVLSGPDIAADVTASADGLPTDLCAVLLPQLSPADCRTALGDSFDHAAVSVKGTNGVLKLVAQAAAPRGKLNVSPSFDLKPFPASVTIDERDENTIACALPRGSLGSQLGVANPFLTDAAEGTLSLKLTSGDFPFARHWAAGNLKATLDARDVKYTTARPSRVARQMAIVAGMSTAPAGVTMSPEAMVVDSGKLTVQPTTISVGDAKATLSGTAGVNGKLSYVLAVESEALRSAIGAPAVRVPLSGTATDPRLDTDAAGRALSADASPKFRDYVAKQTTALHDKELQSLQREKDRQVQELVKPLTAETQP